MDKNYILIIGWVAVMAILSVLTSVKQEETVWIQEHIWRDIRICRERLAGLYHTLER